MQLGQRLLPKNIDFDTSVQYTDKAYFLKGLESAWINDNGQGANEFEFKPAESNFLYCSISLPQGDNTVIGYYFYGEANEGYVVVYNSLKAHFIYRLRGIDGTCEKVYDFCPSIKGIILNPKYFFSEGRITIKSLCRFLPDGTKELYKEMLLVNKKVDNIRLVIEDSIATNSFQTSFFTPHDNCCGDRCRIIKTGVPTPMSKIKIVPISPTDAEKKTQNKMLFQMFQFRFMDENAWGQVSEYGLISDQYFNNLAGCSRDSTNQPHCVWLETKTPCPEIVKRTIAVRSCSLNNTAGSDGNIYSEWKDAFTINLYDQTDPNLRWYERKYDLLATDFEFFNDGKNIRIKFCNNRECKQVPLTNVRSQNPAPINSGSVASVSKSLIYGDNENGIPKMSVADIKKISLKLEPTTACEVKYARIKVYAVIHNIIDNQNNIVHERRGKTTFGGFGHDPQIGNTRLEEKVDQAEGTLTSKGGYNQTFPEGVKGFRAGLAGTQYKAESVQFQYESSSGTITPLGIIPEENTKAYVRGVKPNTHWAIQEFDFGMVPLGPYYFEIYGHNDTENIENTSTYYIHTTGFNSYKLNYGIGNNHQKRIFIDTTSGNDFIGLTGDNLAVIADVTNPENLTSRGSNVLRGYVYEDSQSKIPIEFANVGHSSGIGPLFDSTYTDHNGFYFMVGAYQTNYRVQLYGSNKCSFNAFLGETGLKKNEGSYLAPPIYATDKLPDYSKDACNRWVIKGNILECGNGGNAGGGIEGIAVVLKGSKAVLTNSKGEFKVIAHYGNGRETEKLIFSNGSCFVLDCNCKPINVQINVSQPICTNCIESVTSLGNFSLQTIVTKGYPHGSRIQVGMIGHDWLGRQTDLQTDKIHFVDFPSEQEQGNATYPRLKAILPDTFSEEFCRNYSRVTLAWSKNTNYEDFLTWAADEVDFVDSAGNKNSQNPTHVKIWYRSLNAYNILKGGNTNTTWNIVDNSVTRVGDIAEFIQDADGKYLLPNTIGNVQYDQQGSYFLVDFDESLKDLKAGVKFKLKRQYQCEVKKTFYEFGFPINFCVDCKPRDDDGNIVKEIYLDGFSSYTLPRQIPVVTEVIERVDNGDGNIVDKVTEVKNIKQYPYSFEHHSPSDTWGDHCHNGGRVSYENPYEGKKCDRTQIKRTGALNQDNDGAVNYLHYFGTNEDYVIDEQGWGGIAALLVRDDGYLLVICDRTCFVIKTQDDRAVVTEDGYVRLPTGSFFSRPDRNPSANFGCQEYDLNTIRKVDSIVTFLDSSKQAFVMHNFETGVDVSNGIQSWLFPSIKEVIANKDSKYWHSCFDIRKDRIYLTKFNLNNRVFINNELDKSIPSNETIYYNYVTKQWGQMAHFTPEYFGALLGDTKDSQFISFKNGQPYAHHDIVSTVNKPFLNYFGEQCFPVFGLVTNKEPTVDKSFLSNQVFCKQQLFILEKLETSMGQLSKVYEGQWERGEGSSYAAYLCDTNNVDAGNDEIIDPLFDGDSLYGRWLKALYIPEPNYKGEYFVLTAIESFYENRAKEGNERGGNLT